MAAYPPSAPPAASAGPARAWAAGLACWLVVAVALAALDGHIDLANQALLLVLGGALGSLWLPAGPALLAGAGAVLAFNWLYVPPRGSFSVDTGQHALMLGAMAALLAVIVGLMARLRAQAQAARHHQQQAEQLRQMGETLRDSSEPLAHAGALQQALASLVGAPVALLLCRDAPGAPTPETVMSLGGGGGEVGDGDGGAEADADETAGLWLCLRRGQAMGPGSGHHETLAHWYLPLRGRQATLGAAVLRLPAAGRRDEGRRAHAQALCDQMGVALQRIASQRAEQRALAQAHLQAVRNALLAAISHDFRTPLATILGAASSLQDQAERLDAGQRRRLAERIVQEAGHLERLTDNTLQLARLDAPGVDLRLDWESAEELVGTVLRRARQRAPGRLLRARLEPGLPLLHCDALLLTQLLDNLVDNALAHTPADAAVEILVRREPGRPASNHTGPQTDNPAAADHLVLAVRDRGPGVPAAWRERIFEVFQRGQAGPQPEADTRRPGAGVGLAVCRAIARAHGGELRLRARSHGGSSFECHLPLPPPGDGPRLPDINALNEAQG